IHEISRLGRDTFDIQETIQELTSRGVTIQVENLGDMKSLIDGKPNPIFKLIIDVLANISSMQRLSIKEAQAQGIAIAKSDPTKYRGRPIGSGKTAQQLVDENKDVVKRLNQGESLRNTAKLTNHAVSYIQKIKLAMQDRGVLNIKKGAK